MNHTAPIRIYLWTALLSSGALLWACEDALTVEPMTDECGGACAAETLCVAGQCVGLDAGPVDAKVPDAAVDTAPLPPDAFVPLCSGRESRGCVTESGCAMGRQACDEGRFGPCMAPEERCDGLDNDCDESIDEGFDVGDACSTGIGACARDGVLRCGSGGDVLCNATAAEPVAERCNGVDDNCDGVIDEPFADLGQPCSEGEGQCHAAGVVVCGADGLTRCGAQAGTPAAEACDGVDNDCDGVADETDPQLDFPCLTGALGRCGPGLNRCSDGALICEPDYVPRAEVCDGLDDDCDGTIDEDGPALGTGCATESPGICALGAIACAADGTWACTPVFPPGEESCDGLDNDCDGVLDEADLDLGQICETGVPGACATGLLDCRGGGLTCISITDPIAETCNGVDDDCDGAPDEETLLDRPVCHTQERGVCDNGYQACADGEVVCLRAAPPVDELCDGLDNDCDGYADETFPGLGEGCGEGVGACRAPGIIGCTADRQATLCLASPSAPEPERCDGIDNDCDGEIDNFDPADPPREPEHCGACGQVCAFPQARGRCGDGVCRMGLCLPGWVDLDGDDANGCEAACVPTRPALEVCDGLDNDCDGRVDGPQCEGDAFRLCEERRQRGTGDVLCEPFSTVSEPPQFWAGSLVGPGDGAVTRAGAVRGPDGFEGGGLTRRVRYDGPAYALGFHVEYRRAALGVGLYQTAMPVAAVDEGAMPNAGDADAGAPAPEEWVGSRGYSLVIDASPRGPEATVTRAPDGAVLWVGLLPELRNEARHWVNWKRLNGGGWRVELDGRVIHPTLEVEPSDNTVTRFDRVSLWIGPSDAETSGIEGLALQYDGDADGIYAPFDNCPSIFNPRQDDPDGNGRGQACDDRDGDGVENEQDLCPVIRNPLQLDENVDGVGDACDFAHGFTFTATLGGAPRLWTLDLTSGLRQPIDLPIQGAGAEPRASLDGWWSWSDAGTIYVKSTEDAPAQELGQGSQPDFIGESLVFVAPDGTAIMKMPRDGSAPAGVLYQADVTDAVDLTVSPLEESLAVQVRTEADTRLYELDPDGQARLPGVVILSGLDGAFPKISRHPSEPKYLVAAADGPARGLSIIDAEAGLTTPLSDTATLNAMFTPSGMGAVTLTTTNRGRTLSIRSLEQDARPRTLIGPSEFLSPLGLGPAPLAPVMPDGDHDGIPDELDHCPGRHPLQQIEHHPLEGVHGDITLFQFEDTFALSWGTVPPGDRRLGFVRLSRQGEVLASLSFPEDVSVYNSFHHGYKMRRQVQPVWLGDRYDLLYFVGSIHPDYSGPSWNNQDWQLRDVQRVALSDDWRLGDPVSLFAETGEYEEPGLGFGFHPADWYMQSFPWGYRVSGHYMGTTDRRLFDVANSGEVLRSDQVLDALTNQCLSGVQLRRAHASFSTDDTVLVQCALHDRVVIFRLNAQGAVLTTSTLALVPIRKDIWNRGPYVATHDASLGKTEGMSVFVAANGQLRARTVDFEGRANSLERMVSGSVEEVWSTAVSAGDDRYGAVFTAVAGGAQHAALYFVALDRNASPLSEPVQLAAPESAMRRQNLEVAWDGDAWIVLWQDTTGQIQFTRGRFDCPSP